MSMVSEPMSISGLSVLTGMDRRTIGKRLAGMDPAKVIGKAKHYATPEALRAIYLGGDTGEALDVQQESAKHKKAQTEKLNLEIALLKGDLVTGDQAKSKWADMVTAMRAKMLSLPSKLAVRVTGMDTKEVETESRDLVFEALQALADDGSGYKPGSIESDLIRSDVDDRPTAKADSKRVGGRQKSPVKRGKRGTRKVAD